MRGMDKVKTEKKTYYRLTETLKKSTQLRAQISE
jgi:hypothetical protein